MQQSIEIKTHRMSNLRQIPLTCSGHTRPVVHLDFNRDITECGYFLISACKGKWPYIFNEIVLRLIDDQKSCNRTLDHSEHTDTHKCSGKHIILHIYSYVVCRNKNTKTGQNGAIKRANTVKMKQNEKITSNADACGSLSYKITMRTHPRRCTFCTYSMHDYLLCFIVVDCCWILHLFRGFFMLASLSLCLLLFISLSLSNVHLHEINVQNRLTTNLWHRYLFVDYILLNWFLDLKTTTFLSFIHIRHFSALWILFSQIILYAYTQTLNMLWVDYVDSFHAVFLLVV